MTGAILIISLLVIAAIWLAVEWKTLKDEGAFFDMGAPFMLFFFVLGFLCGHLFWP